MNIEFSKRSPFTVSLAGSLLGASLYFAIDRIVTKPHPIGESNSEVIPARQSGTPHLTGVSQGGVIQDLWGAKQLVERDKAKALQICLDGESINPAMWQTVLRSLAPHDLSNAIALLTKGRCFPSPSAREEAVRLLLELFPLQSLIQGSETILAARGPGAQLLLTEFVKAWVQVDQKKCLEFALQIPNAWSRQYALSGVLSGRSDLRSEDWMEAVKMLRPAAVADAVETFTTNAAIPLAERFDWIDSVLKDNYRWPDLVAKLLRESLTVEESYALAIERGWSQDKELMRSLLARSAEEAPQFYADMLAGTQSISERKLGLQLGLASLVKTAPDTAFALLEGTPTLVDPWSVSVLTMGATSQAHLDKIEQLLDESIIAIAPNSMPVINYLSQLTKVAPGEVGDAWTKYAQSIPDEIRLDNLDRLVRDLARNHGESIANNWIQSLAPNEADAARQAIAKCCGN